MLSTAGSKISMADISGMTAAVQGFLNNVVAAAGYGAAVETPEQLKQSVAAAVLGPRHSMELPEGMQLPATPAAAAAAGAGSSSGGGAATAVAGAGVPDVSTSDEEEDEKNTFHLAPAHSSDSTAAAAAAADGGSSSAAAAAGVTSAPTANGGAAGSSSVGQGSSGVGLPPAAAGAGGSQVPKQELSRLGSTAATGGANQGRALLLKDAFLVFRALCKLSIRTSDTVTVSDPTAVRGKVSVELYCTVGPSSGTGQCAELRIGWLSCAGCVVSRSLSNMQCLSVVYYKAGSSSSQGPPLRPPCVSSCRKTARDRRLNL
jgi:brefeldin A-inhibited guanine nucleotide-exchange protein